jgi:hypothetical protein
VAVKTDIRPGCAYHPYKNSVPTEGRFTCIFKDITNGGIKPAIIETEGNDPSTSATAQRLNAWRWQLYYGSYDGAINSAMTLHYNPSFDTNLRGAWANGGPLWFQPLADGGVNAAITDEDDYDLMKKNLACAITFQGCKRCTALNQTTGACATWIDGFPD